MQWSQKYVSSAFLCKENAKKMQKYARYVSMEVTCKICKNMHPPLCWCHDANGCDSDEEDGLRKHQRDHYREHLWHSTSHHDRWRWGTLQIAARFWRFRMFGNCLTTGPACQDCSWLLVERPDSEDRDASRQGTRARRGQKSRCLSSGPGWEIRAGTVTDSET